MSAHSETRPEGAALARRQTLGIIRLEAVKSFLGRRALPLYLLAALPVVVPLLLVLFAEVADQVQVGWTVSTYSEIFQFQLAVVFFGSVWMFTHLFRGEILGRSLHFYLLSPVRRELLVVGKYLSALLASVVLFGLGTLASFLVLYIPFGVMRSVEHLTHGPGLGHLATYLLVTVLACAGYGAVFLLTGLLLRNPIIPAFAVLLWELINFLLPPLLKKFSVVYWLNGLLPVPVDEGPFAMVAEPPAAWMSVVGLVVVSGALLTVAALRARRLEVAYGED